MSFCRRVAVATERQVVRGVGSVSRGPGGAARPAGRPAADRDFDQRVTLDCPRLFRRAARAILLKRACERE